MHLYIFWWQGIAGCYHYAVMAPDESSARAAVQRHIDHSDMAPGKKAQWPASYTMEIAHAGQVVEVDQE